jgi:dienelactone hydrolase
LNRIPITNSVITMKTLSRRDWLASTAVAAVAIPRLAAADDALPTDSRLGAHKTLNDAFPFAVPKSLAAWQVRANRLREQIRVALGLHPMPIAPRLAPIFGPAIVRKQYTVASVAFESQCGHIVCGSLYRPTAGVAPRPAVLFAHGHWADGRKHLESDAAAKSLVDSKAEPDLATARHFMQHMPALLAANGFVCLAIDMVGYADSTAIGHVLKSGVPHPNGFATLSNELHLNSLMGLQILNCLRAVDLLVSLPDVDAKRIGMTGASGGGTQTFITAAIDDRIAVAAPAVMVSTGMQGGCICENCSLMRVNTGNVEIAGLIAPRPLALTAAKDWTRHLMTDGFPELQALYALHGKPDRVTAKAWLEYPHNYNMPARKFVADWMLKHLAGGAARIECEFEPIPVADLSVPVAVLAKLTSPTAAEWASRKIADDQAHLAAIAKTDARSIKTTLITALEAMVADAFPAAIVLRNGPLESNIDGATVHRAWFGRADESDALPCIGAFSKAFTGEKVCLWLHPDGQESLWSDGVFVPAARSLIDAGFAVVSCDCLGTGSRKLTKPKAVSAVYAGFTWGYNRPLVAERVHDILTLTTFATTMLKPKLLHMVGWGAAGPWTGLARVLLGDAITRCAFDMNQFTFANITDMNDAMMLPGALKYGDLVGLLQAMAPAAVMAWNAPKTTVTPDRSMIRKTDSVPAADVVKWLITS